MKRQQGFISVILVIFIIIIAMLGVAAAYLLTVGGTSNRNTAAATQAFYLAESAVQRAMRQLLHPNLSGDNARLSCVAYTLLDTTTLNPPGEFSAVQKGDPNYVSSPSTLSAAIDASATTITVVNASAYGFYGRIMIDHELIDYMGVSGNSFVGVRRGQDGTIAMAHAVGAPVGQFQCNLQATGGVTSLTSPIGRNQLNFGIQLQEGWTVGERTSTSAVTIWRWNRPTELVWNNANASIASAQDLNAVHALNYAYAWAVGHATGGNMFALRWDGSSWSRVLPSPAINKTFNTVFCHAFNDCWALGDNGRVVAYYNGTAWVAGTNPSMPNAVMRSVYCSASNDCWAVGNGRDFVRYTGGGVTAWTTFDNPNSIPNVNYRGIWCNAANDCWAVGDNNAGQDTFVHWNGTSWSRDASDPSPTVDLNAVSCTASDDCWAAGDASGVNAVLVHWNGSNWTNATVNTNRRDLFAIDCFNKNDCWAVGQGGVRVHWDGDAWSVITAGSGSTPNLMGISVVGAYQKAITYVQ